MEVNCNALCLVKLTEYGKTVYNQYLNNYNFTPHAFSLYDDFLQTELWDIMRIFGSCMSMGNPDIPFCNNKITILEED